jgi:Ca2+ transporting ATPase
MDSLASLALATEPPKKELLNRPPYRRDEYIINRKMMKHILGNAIYQIIIVYAIVFGGEHWFPEPDKKFENPKSPGHVYPGRPYDWDMSPLYKNVEAEFGPSRHFTNVFNVFVWL